VIISGLFSLNYDCTWWIRTLLINYRMISRPMEIRTLPWLTKCTKLIAVITKMRMSIFAKIDDSCCLDKAWLIRILQWSHSVYKYWRQSVIWYPHIHIPIIRAKRRDSGNNKAFCQMCKVVPPLAGMSVCWQLLNYISCFCFCGKQLKPQSVF